MQHLHATCVAWNGKGILITGPSGSGKSDLALRLIALGAVLVADDQVELGVQQGQLVARCPASIRGLIEARYIGPLKSRSQDEVVIAVVLEPGTPERLPEPATRSLLGITLPLLILPYLEAGTAAKLKLYLEQ